MVCNLNFLLQKLKVKCSLETEFKCKTRTTKCIPRSSVNNGVKDCTDGSDEKISDFSCYDFEYTCSIYSKTDFSSNSPYPRCISYNMVRDGQSDCHSSLDEKAMIDNCTHDHLFLCQDQSRCLPKAMKCDGFTNCIDGSDEIEGCSYPTIFRRFEKKKAYLVDWVELLMTSKDLLYTTTVDFSKKSVLEKGKLILNERMFGFKCRGYKNKLVTVFQPSSSSKTYCKYDDDKCFNDLGELTSCFRCFDGMIINKGQVCDGTFDCRDLSDECSCELTDALEACDYFHKHKNSSAFFCDLQFDLPGDVDETFCSAEVVLAGFIPMFHSLTENESEKDQVYWRCEHSDSVLIKVENVCDFKSDCADHSDEKYCSSTTHFNCTSGIPVSIDVAKVNDNELDCVDLSDECKDNPISSVKEMIKNTYLRQFVYVTLVGIIVFNVIVLKKNLKKLKSINDNQLTKYFNLIFILNLSFSDLIYGLVLAVIAYSSNKFSGVFCTNNFYWRSSLLCKAMGVLTFISSETSLNILFLVTAFRLYSVYYPFKCLDIKKRTIYVLLLACWLLSFVLSFIPIALEKEFMQNMIISSNILFNNRKADRIILPDELYKLASKIESVWNIAQLETVPPSKSIHNIRDTKNWFFNSQEMKSRFPNTSIDVKMTFGFYSSSSVCLPDFYSKSPVSSKFSLAVISYNLLLISCIAVGYILIFHKIKSTKMNKSSENSLKKERIMSVKILLIVATDIACWLPIIVFSYASFLGFQIPGVAHSVTSIVLLPINSLINPILYSRVYVTFFKKLKILFSKLSFKKLFFLIVE